MQQQPDYSSFSSNDFLDDSYFLAWMRGEDGETTQWWENWLNQHPAQQATVTQAQERYRILVSFKKNAVTAAEADDVWQHITNRIDLYGAEVHSLNRFPYKKWLSIAAAAVVLVAVSVFYFQNNKGEQIIVAADKSMKEITLGDGSVITLRKQAVVKYFSNKTREVWIDGEGFFEVNKQKGANEDAVPFTVHAAELDVTVTGTAFSVTNTSQEKTVILSEGKVTASAYNQALVLQPGDKVGLNGQQFVKTKVNPQLYSAWKDGEFRFDNTTMAELADVVKDTYNLLVVFKNERQLKTKLLSGVITAQSLEAFIKTLSIVLDASVTVSGNQLMIQPK
jgi:transmembrane sensor